MVAKLYEMELLSYTCNYFWCFHTFLIVLVYHNYWQIPLLLFHILSVIHLVLDANSLLTRTLSLFFLSSLSFLFFFPGGEIAFKELAHAIVEAGDSKICRVGWQTRDQAKAKLQFNSVGMSHATARFLMLSAIAGMFFSLSLIKILFILQVPNCYLLMMFSLISIDPPVPSSELISPTFGLPGIVHNPLLRGLNMVSFIL